MFRTVGAVLVDNNVDLLPEINKAISEHLNGGQLLAEPTVGGPIEERVQTESKEKQPRKLGKKVCEKCKSIYQPVSGNQKICLKCKGDENG